MVTSAKKNFIYQALYDVLIIITPLILAPYIARTLGAEKNGVFSLTNTYASYFVLFAMLGIKNYGNREIARIRDNPEKLKKLFSSILYVHLIVSVLAVVGYYSFSLLFTFGKMRIYMFIMGIYVISSVFDISWLFFGLEQFRITVTCNSIIKILSVISTFIFVHDRDDLWIYILIFSLSQLISQLYLWLKIKRFTTICRTNIKDAVSHLPQLFFLFIPAVAVSLYNYMDKIMLGKISNNTELGLYDNAEKIIFTASQIIGAVGTVMMPKMANAFEKKDKSCILGYLRISMQTVMCMTFALTGGIIGIAWVFSPVFWGEEFRGCKILLVFLSLALPFKGFANVLRTQFLVPNRRDFAYTISVCIGAGVNILLNALLIPHMQALGASIGTICAEFAVCIVQIVFCRKELPIKQYFFSSIPFLIIGIFMTIPVLMIGVILNESVITLIIQFCIGAIIYFVLCLVYFKVSNQTFFLKTIESVLNRFRFIKKRNINR